MIFYKNLIFLLVLWIFSTGVSAQQLVTEPTEVIILHTNDMHSRIDNLGKLAYLADSLRRTHPFVFLVAAGDNFTGNPVVDKVEDKGYPMIDLMNHCGFNLSAIGNHEFDLGQEVLNRRIKQALFPFISCNIDASGAVLQQPKPFIVLDAGTSVRLAFLGIVELGLNGLPDSHPLKLTGLRFYNGITKAREYAYLKEKYGVLIGLTHLGVDDDKLLAAQMSQLDVIIGGHSHTLIDTPLIINNVLIVQTGAYMRNIGKLTLHVIEGKVIDKKEEIIPVSSLRKQNTAVQQLIEEYNNNPELNRVVGQSAAAIRGYGELGSLMADAVRQQMKLDFAFQNRGGIRVDSFSAGNIRLKDVYQLDPFGNQEVVFDLDTEQIKSLICNAFNREKSLDLEVSGMTYIVTTDSSRNCIGVEMLDDSGMPVKPGKLYKVGLNSYISSAYSFDHQDAIQTSDLTTADYLLQFLEEKKIVNYQNINRVSIKPKQ